MKDNNKQSVVSDGFIMISLIALATAIGNFFIQLNFSTANVILVYMLAVLLIAIKTKGRAFCFISSLFSVLVFNFFFTEPYFSLFANPSHIATFIVMFFAAICISFLTESLKHQGRLTEEKAYRTEMLLETNQKLQRSVNSRMMINVTARQLVKLLEKDILVYPVTNGKLEEPLIFPKSFSEPFSLTDSAEERSIAEWVIENNRRAGGTTGFHPHAQGIYMAIRGFERVMAVICLGMTEEEFIDDNIKSLVLAIIDECGIIMENSSIAREKMDAEERARSEELKSNLLRSISHDLRTPLTGIFGNATLLSENAEELTVSQRKEIYETIGDDAEWLIHLVENLLSITRIGSGSVLSIESEFVSDVVEEALKHIDRRKKFYHIEQSFEDEMLMARMDVRLIVQVIINIVNNAIKYTPEGSLISIKTFRKNEFVAVEISDNGKGIGEEALEKIFDMFYVEGNSKGDSRRGLGLGLYLCKSIIEAHGGKIRAYNNESHGATFEFALPIAEVTVYE